MHRQLQAVLFVWMMTAAAPVFAGPRLVDVASLEVAGVKLGMSPEVARQVLLANGFNVSSDVFAESWSARVASEAGKYVNTPKDHTRAVAGLSAEGPEYQRVDVSFAITATGSFVRKVEYTRPSGQGSLIGLALKKYGKPTKSGLNSVRYCSSGDGCSDSFMGVVEFPNIEVRDSYSGRSSVTLTQGRKADSELKLKFMKAVQAIAPNYGKAQF